MSRKKTHARKHGLARALSKLGVCSRTHAAEMIRAGRVAVNGRVQLDPERPTAALAERIEVDGVAIQGRRRVYLALNKPRGLIVSASDERGRDTIYELLKDAALPWIAPVGRLDKASEGLLLLSNDPEWAAGITNPSGHVAKTYHAQVQGVPDDTVLNAIKTGVEDRGERLAATPVRVLRTGEKNAWLEIVLEEGRNRHIRRLLAALDYPVLRLVRIAIGPIALGTLAKGEWRHLTRDEVEALSVPQDLSEERYSRGGAAAQRRK